MVAGTPEPLPANHSALLVSLSGLTANRLHSTGGYVWVTSLKLGRYTVRYGVASICTGTVDWPHVELEGGNKARALGQTLGLCCCAKQ